MFTGIITAISSAFIGVMWALINLSYEKKNISAMEQHRIKAYGEYLDRCSTMVEEKYEKNAASMRLMHVPAAQCSLYNADTPLLWNRNVEHSDFLTYRLGIGNLPFQAEIRIPKERFTLADDSLAQKPGMIKERFRMLHDVPVCVNLLEHRIVGVIGGSRKKGAVEVMHNIVAQAAAANCYTDVKMAFIYNDSVDENSRWEYLKWLPHVWSEDRKTRFIARNKIEAGDVLYEITRILRRRAEQENSRNNNSGDGPRYILFVAARELLEDELISNYIYGQEKNYGLTTVFLADSYEELPNSCKYIIQNDGDFQGAYHIDDDVEERVRINFDKISDTQLEYFTRTLSNIKVSEREMGGDIPSSLPFFDMYHVNKLEEFNVSERWRRNRNYDSMKVLIGEKAGGAPWYLDIHEKYHGPHGLVAGTTGSGKSEILQTYILSLAVNFSPDDVGFFIIDYKGGGMANLFNNLPHMIGQISNLSGNQVRRAMVSIKSENRRRQRIFNENGVNNINLYTRLYKNKEASEPIPHIFIIIDEFAELKREEPDFMRELVSVAQVGRSLGVHLILATQKPAGTVDDNIWSNSKFRLCLRVQDKQDSNDMLHKPDAAYITQAGRCYMQVGNDELYELFQSGWSGAAYDENGGRKSDIANMLSFIGRTAVIGNRNAAKQKEQSKKGLKEKTQLDAIIEYLDTAARKNGYTRNLQLWLPVLPETLYLDRLKGLEEIFDGEKWGDAGNEWGIEVPVGLYDDPVNQIQETLYVSLSQNGHHAVVGTVVSGKSTFLQTLVYALVMKYTPEHINLYAIDYSAKMLSAFEAMPHVGGIIYEGENEKLAKFFGMANNILEERKKLFRGGNYSQYVRANGVTLPAVIVVIDNYANFRTKTNNEYEDMVMQLVKDGAGYGIFLVITAGGFGTQEIPSRLADNLRTVICLEMSDRFQYVDAMRTPHIDTLPEVNVKGRGIAKMGEDILEFQTALAFEAEDAFKRMEDIQLLGERMREAWSGKCARRIPEIPEKPVWDEYVRMEEVRNMLSDDRHLPIGYDFKNAAAYGVDLSRTFCYLIAGGAASGKTNLLKVLLHSAVEKGGKIAVIDFNGEFSALAERTGVEYIDDDEKMYNYVMLIESDLIKRAWRKKQQVQEGVSGDELYADMRQFAPIYIFVSNIADFIKHVNHPKEGVISVKDFMINVISKGGQSNLFWFAVYNQDDMGIVTGDAIFNAFKKYKTGIHMGGRLGSQNIFNFEHIHFSERDKPLKTGIGMLPNSEDDDTVKVVVPLCKGVL